MAPIHTAVATLSLNVSKSSSALTITSDKLQNCNILNRISPQGFVPTTKSLFLLAGILSLAEYLLKIPRSPDLLLMSDIHSSKNSSALGFSLYAEEMFAMYRLGGKLPLEKSLENLISISPRSEMHIKLLRLTPPTTTISAISQVI